MSLPFVFPRPRRGVFVAALVAALLVLGASASYGFVLWKEAHAQEEYRRMIYEISTAMGENPGCLD